MAAGLLWAVAAALAVGAQFGDIYRRHTDSDHQLITGFWRLRSIAGGQELSSTPIFYGVSVLVATAALATASLLVFATRQRWAAVVGTLAAGMMLDQAVFYVTIGVNDGRLSGLGPGWWLIVGAAVVAVAGFVVALIERGGGQPAGPYPVAAPFPPPQQTPAHGPPAPGFPPAPPTR